MPWVVHPGHLGPLANHRRAAQVDLVSASRHASREAPRVGHEAQGCPGGENRYTTVDLLWIL